jgi:hypothetical protein
MPSLRVRNGSHAESAPLDFPQEQLRLTGAVYFQYYPIGFFLLSRLYLFSPRGSRLLQVANIVCRMIQ